MSQEKDGFRAGGSVGSSDKLSPANYFRPSANTKAPSDDAPTAQQPAVKAAPAQAPSVAPPNGASAKVNPPSPAGSSPPTSPSAVPASGPAQSAAGATQAPVRVPEPPQGAPEGFEQDIRTVVRPVQAAPASTAAPASGGSKSPEDVLSAPPTRRTRKARLRLSRIDPWSMMKTVFLFSIAGFIISMVSVGVLWTVVEASGLLSDLNEFISTLVSTPSDPTPFDIHQYLNGAKVLGFTAVIGAIDIVLFTALGTLGAFLYNLSATMLGGLELTLAED